MLFGILYAITDEIHQLFVPGRTSSPLDVGIDSLGIVTGIVIFLIVTKILEKKLFYMKKIGGKSYGNYN